MSQEGSGQGEQAGDARGVPTGRERFTACLPCLSASPALTDPVLRAPDTKTPSSEHRCSSQASCEGGPRGLEVGPCRHRTLGSFGVLHWTSRCRPCRNREARGWSGG